MNYDDIVNEIHDELLSLGISRTPAQISYALDLALQDYSGENGWFVSAESVHRKSNEWHWLLNATGGVYDLLEIDAEDVLVDRLAS